jgi:hypothetical protein
MSERHLGRYAVMDGVGRRVGDDALRTHLASFHGPSFAVERDGDDRVQILHDEYGNPVRENVLHHEEGTSGIRSTAGDAAPQTRVEFQRYRERIPSR